MAEDSPPDHSRLSVGGKTFRLSRHSLARLTERGIELEFVRTALTTGEFFHYYHEGSWKDGYYDRSSGVFVGVAGEIITTVIRGASDSYISNLRAGAP